MAFRSGDVAVVVGKLKVEAGEEPVIGMFVTRITAVEYSGLRLLACPRLPHGTLAVHLVGEECGYEKEFAVNLRGEWAEFGAELKGLILPSGFESGAVNATTLWAAQELRWVGRDTSWSTPVNRGNLFNTIDAFSSTAHHRPVHRRDGEAIGELRGGLVIADGRGGTRAIRISNAVSTQAGVIPARVEAAANAGRRGAWSLLPSLSK